MSRVCAVILAGGSGRRAGQAKQFAKVGDKTILAHACDPFLRSRSVDGMVIVTAPSRMASVRKQLSTEKKLLAVVAGGDTRNASSRCGVAVVDDSYDVVLIHDAARPFVTGDLIRRVIAAAAKTGAAIPAVEVSDSIVQAGRGDRLREYVDRSRLRAAQTPQGFRLKDLRRAFARSRRRDFTDDASVMRAAGRPVDIVVGDPANVKITTRADLEAARRRLARS